MPWIPFLTPFNNYYATAPFNPPTSDNWKFLSLIHDLRKSLTLSSSRRCPWGHTDAGQPFQLQSTVLSLWVGSCSICLWESFWVYHGFYAYASSHSHKLLCGWGVTCLRKHKSPRTDSAFLFLNEPFFPIKTVTWLCYKSSAKGASVLLPRDNFQLPL